MDTGLDVSAPQCTSGLHGAGPRGGGVGRSGAQQRVHLGFGTEECGTGHTGGIRARSVCEPHTHRS